tara:strand:+ start:428 stop:655 length:228 start_codon:yes stop_codon:yes gene_type:complete
MIIKENNPRQAIMTSYKRPVLYRNFVLLDGAVKVVFRKAFIDDLVYIVVYKIKKGTTIKSNSPLVTSAGFKPATS